MDSFAAASIAGFFAGITGALGLGGGAVLVLFLTVFMGYPQLAAQGINLLFFIPIGLCALIFHYKNKLLDIKTAVPAILMGLAGSAGGSLIARLIGAGTLRTLFGLALAGLGLWEVFSPHRKR